MHDGKKFESLKICSRKIACLDAFVGMLKVDVEVWKGEEGRKKKHP